MTCDMCRPRGGGPEADSFAASEGLLRFQLFVKSEEITDHSVRVAQATDQQHGS